MRFSCRASTECLPASRVAPFSQRLSASVRHSYHKDSSNPLHRTADLRREPKVFSALQRKCFRRVFFLFRRWPFRGFQLDIHTSSAKRAPSIRTFGWLAPADELPTPESAECSFVRLNNASETQQPAGFHRSPSSQPVSTSELPPQRVGSETQVHGFHQQTPANSSSSQHRRRNLVRPSSSAESLQRNSLSSPGCPFDETSSRIRPSESVSGLSVSIDRPLACEAVFLHRC